MFSLGLCLAAVFNNGKSLIEAQHSISQYTKQLDTVRKNCTIQATQHGQCKLLDTVSTSCLTRSVQAARHGQYTSSSTRSVQTARHGQYKHLVTVSIQAARHGQYKLLDTISDQINTLLPKIPIGLHEAAVKLVNRDSNKRPTAQLLAHIKFFK
ncbi:hypothetical protein HAZT_HAZT006300 [Hyalella azteca]|uniref:Uncharacterized protein n=1 Tax=Hyalella azteca TaxID=294128 RepID=A0A6A0GV91_HYAAZ|nr:hypothetical protein HAZT_HAZT006300 [Hyalella azteca]